MHTPRNVTLAAFVASAFLLLASNSASAQNPNLQKVRFATPDGVEIQGYWYASARNAPVVMILHDLGKGQHCNRKEWNTLATQLQQAGFAVLAFDFRGHGQSTAVKPQFDGFNAKYGVRSQQGVIDVKDFRPAYVPVIANDIAAAKAFLDIKNDAGECNSSSLVLVGAGKGASLGALWMKSEWFLHRVMRVPNAFGQITQRPSPTSQGKCQVAAVWLSMSPIWNGKPQASTITSLLTRSSLNNMPMTFLYNSSDETQTKMAKYCIKKLKNDKNPKHKYIGQLGVAGALALSGRELLLTKGTTSGIVKWLGNLKKEALFNNWVSQNFPQTPYVWITRRGARPVIASNGNGTETLRFLNYGSFVTLP